MSSLLKQVTKRTRSHFEEKIEIFHLLAHSPVSNVERLRDIQLVFPDLNMMIVTKKTAKLRNAGNSLKILFTSIALQIHLCFLFPFSPLI